MAKSTGKTYYIISGMCTHNIPLKTLRLVTESCIDSGSVAVAVTVPRNVKLEKHHDEQFDWDYWVAQTDKLIEEFSPTVLLYTYGEWKEIFGWEDFRGKTIFEYALQLGYKFDSELGFMNAANTEHQSKFTKMLFG